MILSLAGLSGGIWLVAFGSGQALVPPLQGRHVQGSSLGRRVLFTAPPIALAGGRADAAERSVEDACQALDKALREDIWFVSGRVRKEFFAPGFRFEDPDVKLEGIDAYGRGVASLFDQDKTRAEILDVTASGPREIRVRWRLAAVVGLPPTLPIRLATAELEPYVVTSILHLDGTGQIDFQKDEFDRPTSDLLKSARFTFR